MAASQMTERDLEASRRSVIIQNVSIQTKVKDIERVIEQKVGSLAFQMPSGKPYEINGKQFQKIYVNFYDEREANALMASRPFIVNREELTLLRHNPKQSFLAGHRIYTLSVTMSDDVQGIHSSNQLSEHDLDKYFKQFGTITACERLNTRETLLQFKDYDSVDLIILHAVSHVINRTTIVARKTRAPIKSATTPELRPSCIHVTNMPVDVTSNELASIFKVRVANILLQPGCELNEHLSLIDRSSSEAWIKDIGTKEQLAPLAVLVSRKSLRGYKITCDVIDEPFEKSELCADDEKGECSFPSNLCHYKHIQCNKPNTCTDKECWYGHSKKRPVLSNPRSTSGKRLYRMRISNLHPSTTEDQLLKGLGIAPNQRMNLRFSENRASNTSMVAYFVHQLSERFLRKKISAYHDKPLSNGPSNPIQLQLEKNANFFRWDDEKDAAGASRRSSMSSSASLPIKLAPWCKDLRAQSFSTSSSNDSLPNSITDTVQMPVAQPPAQHERFILEKLAELSGVPRLIAVSGNERQSIMESIEGVTLRNYIRKHPADLHRALTMMLDLLAIVKDIHSRKVAHRDINPDNIIVGTPPNEDQLVLIGFGSACLIGGDHGVVPEDYSSFCDPPEKLFYRAPQMEIQQRPKIINGAVKQKFNRSPTIDTSHICAVLFWLITHEHPKESRDINGTAPHEKKEHAKLIHTAVERATGIWTGKVEQDLLTQQLKLIFDRGFADFIHQWRVEELAYQLRFALQLTMTHNKENNSFPLPLAKTDSQFSFIPSEINSFGAMVTLIDAIKKQIQLRYPDIVWQGNAKNQWSGSDQHVEYRDALRFPKPIQMPVVVLWHAEINTSRQLLITISVAIKDATVVVVLPIGVWKQDTQKNIAEECLGNCEVQLKNVFNILREDRNV